jgi:hypothetical protein
MSDSESGPAGAFAERALVATARANGMRVIGPNCLGISGAVCTCWPQGTANTFGICAARARLAASSAVRTPHRRPPSRQHVGLDGPAEHAHGQRGLMRRVGGCADLAAAHAEGALRQPPVLHRARGRLRRVHAVRPHRRRHYLGAYRPSPTWPRMPRATEAFSTQCRPSICASTASTGSPHGPVLWMRGDSDLIVSDTSAYDLAYLGR